MRLSYFLNPEHPADSNLTTRLNEHLEQVQLARDAGFDGVFIGHHLSYEGAVWLPPLPTLARVIKVKARKPGGKLKKTAAPRTSDVACSPLPAQSFAGDDKHVEHPGLGDFMAASPDAYAARLEFATRGDLNPQALRTTLREQFLTSSLSYEACGWRARATLSSSATVATSRFRIDCRSFQHDEHLQSR